MIKRNFFNRKGITPIISVVLLLMMTIAIAGLAYTWLQRMEASIQSSTENTTEELMTGFKAQLSIDGYKAKCYSGTSDVEMSFYIRNSGTKRVKNLRLYADNALINVSNYTSLGPGNTTSFALGNRTCSDWINETRTIKVTSDQVTSETLFEITCSSGSCS
ncbi:MAG: archaellin/type IV pilin N-terminal domain-containing protein [Candidatus Undinarchaeales archaeon]